VGDDAYAYQDLKNAEAAFKLIDAGLLQTTVPEIRGLMIWDRQLEERRVQRDGTATRITVIIEVDGERKPIITEMVENLDPPPVSLLRSWKKRCGHCLN
jgi:hypothetical protein